MSGPKIELTDVPTVMWCCLSISDSAKAMALASVHNQLIQRIPADQCSMQLKSAACRPESRWLLEYNVSSSNGSSEACVALATASGFLYRIGKCARSVVFQKQNVKHAHL